MNIETIIEKLNDNEKETIQLLNNKINKMLDYRKHYYNNNKEKIKSYQKIYYAENREDKKTKMLERYYRNKKSNNNINEVYTEKI